ncbi:MAG: HAD-IB family phosphatase [Chitinophagales bacterium]|nr:HAD-IB family phosphatase [Chitinophagales bacterium]
MNLIFDFDSTLIRAEGLDILAEICCGEDPSRIVKIRSITNKGMMGHITMQASLQSRLAILHAQKKDIALLIEQLFSLISPSIEAIKDHLKTSRQNMYVLSGGFIEYVAPICEYIGFAKENIIANRFVYYGEEIAGFDEKILVSQTLGKPRVIKSLNLEKPVYIVGDGYTDLEVKLEGAANYFLAFTETIYRENVVKQADAECKNFNEVVDFIQRHHET